MTYIKQATIPKTVFGEVMSGQLTPIFQGTFEYTVDNIRRLEKDYDDTDGIVQANGMAQLTAGTNDFCLLKSKHHAKYKSGFGAHARFSTIYDAGAASTNQLVGLFDALSSDAAEGSVELTGGGSGSVDSITVNGVTITSGAEAFDTSLAQTAQNVVDNINANDTTPNYRAYREGVFIYIVSRKRGTTPNGYVVVSSTTTITSSDVNLSGGTNGTTIFKNGFTVGYVGATFGFHIFQNDTITTIAQANWDDPCDGSGPSGITLDHTKLNVWQLRYQYLGAGAQQLWVESETTGEFVLVHTRQYANQNTEPSVYNPNFHLGYYVEGSGAASKRIYSASYVYFVEGKQNLQQIDQPQFGTGKIQKTTVTTETALFTIRSRETYASKENFIDTILEYISVSIEAGAANNLGSVRILRNAELAGTPSWTDIDTASSVVEIDVSMTTVIDEGQVLLTAPLAGKNDKFTENINDLVILLKNGETLSVMVESANSATFEGSLLWKDMF